MPSQHNMNIPQKSSLHRPVCMAVNTPESEDLSEYDELAGTGKASGTNTQTTRPTPKEPDRSGSNNDTPTLDKYGVSLNDLARAGKLDPVYGREEELHRVAQILARKRKNNPLLIGAPGVGKTAVVEALAQKIVNNDVPLFLLNKKIISVDLASIVAGAMYRGQFEERMKTMIDELRKNPHIILYIDEIHTLMGGGNSQGGLDAANILKPALSRGEIRCIGATTPEEYRKTIEKDGAMDRRFQKVTIEAPDSSQTLKILQKLKPTYEMHHHVLYTDDALRACVRYTDQYVTDRFFPDKAIDAMDEAGAYAYMNSQKPIDFSIYEDRIQAARQKKLQAVKDGNYEDASRYRDEEKQYASRLDQFKKDLEAGKYQEAPVSVDVATVEHIVSLSSGIPVSSFTRDDLTSLAGLSDRLKAKVKGQDHVIEAVSGAIRRNKIGLRDPSRPIGTFLFLGSSGVGKTHLSKQLARELFGSEEAMIRVDMSEFMERHTVSRLIGAPPGYVGYDEGGELTAKVRRRPYSVILFDEIEKAHPDVHNLLLQLLDDGILTDSNGGKVNFKNTIIIMTSNVGTRQLNDFGAGIGFRDEQADLHKLSEEVIKKALKKAFSPEFLNRIDRIVTFNPLTPDIIRDIVDIELEALNQRIGEMGMTITLTSEAKDFLAEKGYDPALGARPLRRAIAMYVEEVITQALLDETAHRDGSYTLSVNSDHTTLKLTPLES